MTIKEFLEGIVKKGLGASIIQIIIIMNNESEEQLQKYYLSEWASAEEILKDKNTIDLLNCNIYQVLLPKDSDPITTIFIKDKWGLKDD